MSQTNAESQALTPAQFQEQALLLAKEIVDKVLRQQQPLRTTVVMEALIALYCYHARSLPPEAMGDVAMALAGVAGEFLKASSTPQSAPAGAPIH
ncbi:hypothetical protein [Alicycliphilus denitrificans]|uniref:hypothetical protein n=1 Tax=Alicycliphilus denitrificans TaxID=179636 RepID=UPI0001D9EDE3|nr:hypothetical protein [Alicycliphilus denitrificans]ADU99794.1 hypothetical protein Alide_2051 [Alicycliphilus denitrificans BC]